MVKIAPTVAAPIEGFPKKDHDIDSITDIPDQINLEQLIDTIREKCSTSLNTQMQRTIWTHIIHNVGYKICNSTKQCTIPDYRCPWRTHVSSRSQYAEAWEDIKLLYSKQVYNFKLETIITTALKNILMSKLDETSFIVLKEEYIVYTGQSVWEFILHLITTYGEKKMDETLKANLRAMEEEYDCMGHH